MSALFTNIKRLDRALARLNDCINEEGTDSLEFERLVRHVCSIFHSSIEFQPSLVRILEGDYSNFPEHYTPGPNVVAGLAPILPCLHGDDADLAAIDFTSVNAALAWLVDRHQDALSSPLSVLNSIRSVEHYLVEQTPDGLNDGQIEAIRAEVSELCWRIDGALKRPCGWEEVLQNANANGIDLLENLKRLRGVSAAIEQAAEQWPSRIDQPCLDAMEFVADSLESALRQAYAPELPCAEQPCFSTEPAVESGTRENAGSADPAYEPPPAGSRFEFGPVSAPLSDLARWIGQDQRTLKNNSGKSIYYIRRVSRCCFEVWFDSKNRYAEVNRRYLESRSDIK